jgi:hypothetical protein
MNILPSFQPDIRVLLTKLLSNTTLIVVRNTANILAERDAGQRQIYKKVFSALFAAYVLFAVGAALFDPHGAIPSETCPVCSMGASLFSALSSSSFTPPDPTGRHSMRLVENIQSFNIQIISSSLTNRSPPSPRFI